MGPKKSILIVDDEPDARKFLRARLEAAGYGGADAADGIEALGKYTLALAGRPFDLVILDIMMPGMDGTQVLEVIRKNEELRGLYEERERTPIIMLTADYKSYMDAFKRGCDDYLLKPYEPEALLKTIASKFF
ncbi:MAG: response regulator transcription factor [Candidatus Omnitrophica bacterium]|nr:response regulator transcription factor [Candidatus Omnitrophota bacterium]